MIEKIEQKSSQISVLEVIKNFCFDKYQMELSISC